MSTAPRKFDPGQIVATLGTTIAYVAAGINPMALISRHLAGDWGDLDPDDLRTNDWSVQNEARILSAYTLPSGTRIWVITEADRSSTCILLPEEY
jgi:hypothetical protein